MGAAAGLLEAVAKRGGSVERVLRASGLRERDLADPEHFVELEKMLVLQTEAAREVGDPALAMKLAQSYHPNRLGVLAYAVLNAPTVGVAMHNLERYAHTLMHGVPLVIRRRGADCLAGYDIPVGDRELGRQNAEGASVISFEMMRRLIGPGWRPKRVEFGHRRPADVSEYERVFGVPIRFEAENSFALVIDAADLERPVLGADARILPIVQRYLDELPPPAGHYDAWPREVRALIARDICNGHPNMERIARRLGLSGRTLQRRLAERGLVWKTMVEEVRRELALRYLKDDTTTLTEIAFLLGYSDLSAFGRAFRRWTGISPAAQRRLRRTEAGGAAGMV